MKKILKLDINYSAIQLLYFGSFAALMGYASVYLLSKGISNSVIGMTLAAVSIVAFFAQPIVASFADSHKNLDLRFIIIAILAMALGLNVLITFLGTGSAILLCTFIGIATCMMTIQPLLNSLAFLFEKKGIAINFGLARGVGSAGYAIISLAVGYIVDAIGANVLPWIYLGINILVVICVYTFVVPKQYQNIVVEEEVKEAQEDQLSFFAFVGKYNKFTIFCVGSIFLYFAHTIINNFFIQIITPIGGTSSSMGIAVFLAAMLELPAMSSFDKIREKFGCKKLIAFSAILFIVKHVITWLAPNMFFIYLAQCVQMGAYAIFLPATVFYANSIVEKEDAVKGQSMITMATTASGIIANFAGGFLLDKLGVNSVLFIGVIVTVIGVAITIAFTENVD